MVNTVDITEDAEHGKRDRWGYISKRRPSKPSRRRMRTPLLLLLICLLAAAGRGTSITMMPQSAVALMQADAQKSFDKLKTLEGTWEGHVTTVPHIAAIEGPLAQVSMRVTSRGNALMHEMRASGLPDDPITMFYLEEGRLQLTHYCDAGNRPRMAGKISPDGKTWEFDFLDITGGTQDGHMHHTMFTIIDANHHTEEWTFMLPGDKSVRAHFDLQRTK